MQLISRLQVRLGDNKVFKLVVKEDHRPEKAGYTSTRFSTTPERNGHVRKSTKNYYTAAQRPLWLCDPRPLTHTPHILEGPERIAAGWWTSEKMVRDYYIARFATGNIGWIYQDCQGGWFIHGWFS